MPAGAWRPFEGVERRLGPTTRRPSPLEEAIDDGDGKRWRLRVSPYLPTRTQPASRPTIGQHAVQRLHSAGRRADPAAARSLLGRAHALAREDALRARVAVDLAEQLIEGRDLTRVDALLQEAEADPAIGTLATLTRLEWLSSTRPHEALQALNSTLGKILDQLSEAGDDRGLARAHVAAVSLCWMACQASAAAEHARLAAAHAANTGDDGLPERALGWYPAATTTGPMSAAAIANEIRAPEQEEHNRTLQGVLRRLAVSPRVVGY